MVEAFEGSVSETVETLLLATHATDIVLRVLGRDQTVHYWKPHD